MDETLLQSFNNVKYLYGDSDNFLTFESMFEKCNSNRFHSLTPAQSAFVLLHKELKNEADRYNSNSNAKSIKIYEYYEKVKSNDYYDFVKGMIRDAPTVSYKARAIDEITKAKSEGVGKLQAVNRALKTLRDGAIIDNSTKSVLYSIISEVMNDDEDL